MHTQDAYASGVRGEALQKLAESLSATNTTYKDQSKHCKMHCQPPASKAKAKGKAKAAAKAAS